jgi:hypothetical protein
MPTPVPALSALLAAFTPAFTSPTFAHALVLVYGVLLGSADLTDYCRKRFGQGGQSATMRATRRPSGGLSNVLPAG